MVDDIRKKMASYQPVRLDAIHDSRDRAAVLIPVLSGGEPKILLTERAGSLNSHGGEVSFPGGKEDSTDPSLEYTALRECHEELAIKPEDVEIVGALRPFISKYGLIVTPFVGILPRQPVLSANPDEISAVFEVPLAFFSAATPVRVDEISRHGESYHVPSFDYDGHEIWGLTSMIIIEFLAVTQS